MNLDVSKSWMESRAHLEEGCEIGAGSPVYSENILAQPDRTAEHAWHALAEKLAQRLSDVAGYLASVRTDRVITQEGTEFALQTLEWAEGAAECAEQAQSDLALYEAMVGKEEDLKKAQQPT